MSQRTLPPDLSAAHDAPDRNLALELVRVTEAAAMAAGRWVGRGDKNGADGVAVNAMRTLISSCCGRVCSWSRVETRSSRATASSRRASVSSAFAADTCSCSQAM